MSQNFVYNLITFVFICLTVVIGILVLATATESIDPLILAPEDTAVPPTSYFDAPITPPPGFVPTFTPSNTPFGTPPPESGDAANQTPTPAP